MKPKKFEIMPWLFLVKINKQEQKNFKEKINKNSPFFMPKQHTHNTRNMEQGEIVQIGEDMKDIYGWEKIKVGHTLIFHHTIETPPKKDSHEHYWLFEDETHNYYAVDSINLRGFYDGKTVTPHPNFVFLKNIPCYNNDETDSITGSTVKKAESGLYVITDWENSASNVVQKSQQIKEHIESLAKSKRTPEIQRVMEDLEQQRIDLNRKAQKRMYLPYRVAWTNRKLDRDFGRKLVEDDVLYCFNKACLYISNFQDKEYSYIVCLVEHIGSLVNPEV